jgi:hypothetical protein
MRKSSQESLWDWPRDEREVAERIQKQNSWFQLLFSTVYVMLFKF